MFKSYLKFIIFLLVIAVAAFVFVATFINSHSKYTQFKYYAHHIANESFSKREKSYVICNIGTDVFPKNECSNFRVESNHGEDQKHCQFIYSNASVNPLGFFINDFEVVYITNKSGESLLSRINRSELKRAAGSELTDRNLGKFLNKYPEFNNLKFKLKEKEACNGFFIYKMRARDE
ncbi:hypothetical protein ABVF61_20800 [Roseibium sp. HPY-6]|uniref:hypothetical protein n=1 Tax=Roseibium sp. HPY-6 TaxID=3229852 RepID=UPI00338E3D75